MTRITHAILGMLILGMLISTSAYADPCGMVPPITRGPGKPIERVGVQKTYVFFQRGIETIVIRPGFKGTVDNFGMLIPFPSPPAIRKMPDDIFPHVAASIDPPEVVAYVQRHLPMPMALGSASGKRAKKLALNELAADTVRVLREEAVGMYEVAVLAAGSAKALKRWMDEKRYRYPKGMDKPVQDYVQAKWTFVAVKTRVGRKAGVDPRPGMRSAKATLRPEQSFDGHVQAMGFRFRSNRLVVPMRLSAFNGGRMRNIVYLLTESPQRVAQMPAKYVVRQIPGRKLYQNLTRPLPLRVHGGTINDLKPWQRNGLKQRRNPDRFLKYARQLFSSDIHAAARGRLFHEHEETEKDLLRISERLSLRGKSMDNAHEQAIKKQAIKSSRHSLHRIKQLTLTIIDGDFARDVVANTNLTFAHYRMPSESNNARNYNARREGPGLKKPSGKLYRSALPASDPVRASGASNSHRSLAFAGIGSLALLLFSFVRKRFVVPLTLAFGVLLSATTARANDPQLKSLIENLKNRTQASHASAQLVKLGSRATDALINIAFDATDPVQRGWAVVSLAEIGGPVVNRNLKKLHSNPNHPLVVRTWAAAARVRMARDTQTLVKLSRLMSQFPALKRPLGMRIAQMFSGRQNQAALEQMLEIATTNPQLQQALLPTVLKAGYKPLMRLMVGAKKQQVRRQAAAFIATLAQRKKGLQDEIAAETVRVLRFRPSEEDEPWKGGPLFLPSIRWTAQYARPLVNHLIAWHVWADTRDRRDVQRQLHNNLRSVNLARAAGYSSPGWSNVKTERWLKAWGKTIGRNRLRKLLLTQGWATYRRYKHILSAL